MLWDKMSCFSFGQDIPLAQNTTGVSSKVIDTRLNQHVFDDSLRVFAMITGKALTAGKLTVELHTSDEVASGFAKIAEGELVGNKLLDVAFPRNAKRFLKLVYKVPTALNRAVTVWAGLLPDTEVQEKLKLQNLNVVKDGVNTGAEDLSVGHETLV